MKVMYGDIWEPVSIQPRYKAKYAILINRTPEEIAVFSRKNEGVFVFTFLTGLAENQHSYRSLQREPNASPFIAMPVYLGDISPVDCIEDAMRQIISAALGCDLAECNEVTGDLG